MEVAENDEGFESCDEEEESGHKKKKNHKQKRRTGDPNKDFEIDLAEVADEEAKSKNFKMFKLLIEYIKLGRQAFL